MLVCVCVCVCVVMIPGICCCSTVSVDIHIGMALELLPIIQGLSWSILDYENRKLSKAKESILLGFDSRLKFTPSSGRTDLI